jgi:pimeloyl-ACP methyl ester carboxylesterase
VKFRSERFAAPPDGDRQLHALHWGDAGRSPLVLLHGGGANAHWWDHLAPRLAEHFHVVALDFRGHGDSDWPDPLEAGAFSRDLDALLAHLGSREVCLVGHSMGGQVALEHASEHPETRAVCAIDVSRGASRRERRRTRLALAARRSYATREAAIERYRFLPPAPRAPESLRRAIAEHSIRQEPDGRFGFKFDPRWFGLPPGPPLALDKISCPALVVRGALSPLLSEEGLAEMVAALPRGRGVEIPGAGHNVHLECPEAVLAALLELLSPFADDAGGGPSS